MATRKSETGRGEAVGHYVQAFEAFEAGLNGQAATPLHRMRRNAIRRFADLGFPTSRDEAWKTVDLTPITAPAFSPAVAADAPVPDEAAVAPFRLGLEGPTLVFVNGHFSEALSTTSDLPGGLTVDRLGASENPGADAYLARIAAFDAHALTALNTAFLVDGALVRIARDADVTAPVHILNLSVDAGDAFVAAPRALILSEPGSRATVVETFAGLARSGYLNNAVTEVHVGENAELHHVRTTLEGPEARHTTNLRILQERASRFTSHTISIDGAFTRNDISAVLAGEGCESTVNGFYILSGEQYCDNYTLLDHRQPNCPSHELFKGILDGQSRAVFRGKIHVDQIAQKTDAYQQNQNILLSDTARVNTKPQLEIYADDVKCSHGATVGQLDADALFYLRARGISRRTAYRILLHAFAEDILNRIRVEPLRDALTERVLARIDQNGQAP